MELVETDCPPGSLEFSRRILVVGDQRCVAAQEFGVVQQELCFTVGGLLRAWVCMYRDDILDTARRSKPASSSTP